MRVLRPPIPKENRTLELIMRLAMLVFLSLQINALPIPVFGQTVASGDFRIGAAKIDLTPSQGELPKAYLGVLDHVFARAIVIDNGHTSAALVTLDAGGVPNELWVDLSARAEKELGIPSNNVLLTATHSHSVPMVIPIFGHKQIDQASVADYEEKVFQSIKSAKAKLQPARIAYGTGLSYLNVQRDIIDPVTHRWWEGANYDGASDKTVAVITFESLHVDR